MSNTPSLLPCPFCSGANVKIHVYKGEAPDAFVQCHDCSSSGPSGESTTGAIEAWNRRTSKPVVREQQWIDPNDKTQRQYLPHIGEPVLFCHMGKTYYGKHTGGSFVSGVGFAQKQFNTWDCHWMYPPAAHGITQKGGQQC